MRSLCSFCFLAVLTIVLVLAAIIFTSDANGQCVQGYSGYRPTPRAQAPYFAKYPPVYYSHSVKRPYGVSPYAVNQGGLPSAVQSQFPRTNPIVKRNVTAEAVPPATNPRRPLTPSRVIRVNNVSRGWRTNPYCN